MEARWTEIWADQLTNRNVKCFETSWLEIESYDDGFEMARKKMMEWAEGKKYYYLTCGGDHYPISFLFKHFGFWKSWEREGGPKVLQSIERTQETFNGIHAYGASEIEREYVETKIVRRLSSFSALLMTPEDRPLEELMKYFGKGRNGSKLMDVNPFQMADMECDRGGIVIMSTYVPDGIEGFYFFMKKE